MKPRKPKNTAEQAVARKAARKILDEALPTWGKEQRVTVFDKDGRIVIVRGGYIVVDFSPADIPENIHIPGTIPDDLRELMKRLTFMVEEQSMIANWTQPFAAFDVDTTHKKVEAGTDAGKKSARDERFAVEQLVRACIRQNEDPKLKTPARAEEFNYSPRHIRNIIDAVIKESARKPLT